MSIELTEAELVRHIEFLKQRENCVHCKEENYSILLNWGLCQRCQAVKSAAVRMQTQADLERIT